MASAVIAPIQSATSCAQSLGHLRTAGLVRLDDVEAGALAASIDGIAAHSVELFGSRTDPAGRGGDIDLAGRMYSPQEREPYDALSDRFLRAFESSLKFFRTWERVREANLSETYRDLLLRMEKLGLISSLAEWITLRDLRSRVVLDYLPEELAALYRVIIEEAVPEFRRLEAAAADRLR